MIHSRHNMIIHPSIHRIDLLHLLTTDPIEWILTGPDHMIAGPSQADNWPLIRWRMEATISGDNRVAYLEPPWAPSMQAASLLGGGDRLHGVGEFGAHRLCSMLMLMIAPKTHRQPRISQIKSTDQSHALSEPHPHSSGYPAYPQNSSSPKGFRKYWPATSRFLTLVSW